MTASQVERFDPKQGSLAAKDSWVRKKTADSLTDVDYKKLALVNDDLLKVCFYNNFKNKFWL